MRYEEYREILDSELKGHEGNDGIIEYIFSYENKLLPHDHMDYLNDKAIQAIKSKNPLPLGIRLEKCIYHGRKG